VLSAIFWVVKSNANIL